MHTIQRSICWPAVVLATGVLLLAAAWPAAAQLTSADIEALRAQGVAEGWTFTVSENPATQRPPEVLHGLKLPKDWKARGRTIKLRSLGNLPARFDWRDYNGVTPVKDQLWCGSCWAFAAVAVVEASWKIQLGETLDFSEQWVVSCNPEPYSYSCDGGFIDLPLDIMSCTGPADWCGKRGPVRESAYPYQAADPFTGAPCNCPYPNATDRCVEGWAYVDNEWDVPSVQQIKQAIYDHGPVACGICANAAFDAYNGGVFNACADSWTNHAVVLVGWNDRQGSDGVWIMKNSWSTDWGEDGYMRIEYGCSRIGEAAAFVLGAFRDCNGNGIPDPDDIAAGTSEDCNTNGMPDECESDLEPRVVSDPASAEICLGERAMLFVTAKGDAPLAYQWSKDGAPIAGATSSKYVIAAMSEADAGVYECVVSNGCGTDTSAPAVLGLAACPPLAPTTCAPECESMGVPRSLELTWSACTRADGYDVYLGLLDSSLEKIGSTIEPRVPISDLKYGQKYFWRVVATNDAGQTPGPVWWFRTEYKPIPKPTQPLAVSPPDGATDVPLGVTFEWQPAVHAEFYQILLGTNPDGPLSFAGSTKSVTFKPLELAAGKTYFWQVAAWNQGVYTHGPVYSFTTAAPKSSVSPPPQDPTGDDAQPAPSDSDSNDDGGDSGADETPDDTSQPALDRPALGVCPATSTLLLTLTVAGLCLARPRRRRD